jgi:hypothetical protein
MSGNSVACEYPGVVSSQAGASLPARTGTVSSGAVRPLWSRDISLTEDERNRHQRRGNLNWLDLPQQIGRYMQRVSDAVIEAQRNGFQDLVFVAISDSNLAMEGFRARPPSPVGGGYFFSTASIQQPSRPSMHSWTALAMAALTLWSCARNRYFACIGPAERKPA